MKIVGRRHWISHYRFVQQIARNISIGPSPKCISVEKLAEEVQHIGNSEGTITKEELLKWMLDGKKYCACMLSLNFHVLVGRLAWLPGHFVAFSFCAQI